MVSFEFDFKDFIAIIRAYQDDGVLPEVALEKAIHDLGKDYLLQVDKISVSGFPLGSMYASGKFRDKVFVTRSGEETHVRKYVKPRDPKTLKQQTQRLKFKLAVRDWQDLTTEEKNELDQLATKHGRLSGFNYYISRSIRNT